MLFRGVSRSLNRELSHERLYLCSIRCMSISPGSASNYSESPEDFEGRMTGKSPTDESFYQQLGKREKAFNRHGFESGFKPFNRHGFESGFGEHGGGSETQFMDGMDGQDSLDQTITTINDGMEVKLKQAATYFEINPDEIKSDDYVYRPDKTFRPGDNYEPKDLDLTKPGVYKPAKRHGFEVTTKEVREKTDFRNVRFLANFITEAGIIIKRSQTKISAKAQRKVAREIKTARAFGLMPFTTMGQYPFYPGKSREDLVEEDDFESYVPSRIFVGLDPIGDSEIIPDPDIVS